MTTCLRIRVVFLPLLWCSFLALAGPTHAQTKKPNILVIMGDDIGVVQPQLRPASFNVDEVMRKLAPKD